MAKLVAVVGMPGSGKGEVVSYLVSCFGFHLIYFGGTTLRILDERGLPHTEGNERAVREELRAEHGMAAYAKLNRDEISVALSEGRNVVIDGLYSWEEWKFLTSYFPDLIVVAVFAPPKLRYERLSSRPVRLLTEAEAIKRDYAQLENLHTGGPIAMADVTLSNIGTIPQLCGEINKLMARLRK